MVVREFVSGVLAWVQGCSEYAWVVPTKDRFAGRVEESSGEKTGPSWWRSSAHALGWAQQAGRVGEEQGRQACRRTEPGWCLTLSRLARLPAFQSSYL